MNIFSKKNLTKVNKSKKDEIKIHQIWKFYNSDNENPFKTTTHYVEILGYKNNYVNYRFLSKDLKPGYIFQNESHDEGTFRHMYELFRDTNTLNKNSQDNTIVLSGVKDGIK